MYVPCALAIKVRFRLGRHADGGGAKCLWQCLVPSNLVTLEASQTDDDDDDDDDDNGQTVGPTLQEGEPKNQAPEEPGLARETPGGAQTMIRAHVSTTPAKLTNKNTKMILIVKHGVSVILDVTSYAPAHFSSS